MTVIISEYGISGTLVGFSTDKGEVALYNLLLSK
jgi:hypothetical protein